MKHFTDRLRTSDIGYARVYGAIILFTLIIVWHISGPLSTMANQQIAVATPTITPTLSPTVTPASQMITVYVVGQVTNPGVYRIPYGSIVDFAVTQAGGFTKNADPLSINLAYILRENCMIVVGDSNYTGQSIISCSVLYPTESKDEIVLNINTATLQELCTLPGIGEAIANRIIKYREKQRFNNIEEIMNVSGIGQSKFDGIKDLIRVD